MEVSGGNDMKKTFEITAKLKRVTVDCAAVIRITWNVKANDMCEAISKAREYIRMAERDECASCIWMSIEEVQDA